MKHPKMINEGQKLFITTPKKMMITPETQKVLMNPRKLLMEPKTLRKAIKQISAKKLLMPPPRPEKLSIPAPKCPFSKDKQSINQPRQV